MKYNAAKRYRAAGHKYSQRCATSISVQADVGLERERAQDLLDDQWLTSCQYYHSFLSIHTAGMSDSAYHSRLVKLKW